MFIVPKLLVNADGSLGERNDVQSISIEHKLGIHASPTCVMAYGQKQGAIGYLVGEANRGLEYMFVMMNAARLSVGLEGYAVADRAYQQAAEWARTRVQGKPPVPGVNAPAPIIHHPDVKRMLLTMKSQIEALRAVALYASFQLDLGARHPDAAIKAAAQARGDLLIPVVKACSTEAGIELSSLGVQIHGGMGFVEETGAAQPYRDVRITTIYEGTTQIQALDLLGRKTLHTHAAGMKRFIGQIEAFCAANPGSEFLPALQDSVRLWSDITAEIGTKANEDPDALGAAAYDYLFLSAYICLAYWWAEMARVAAAGGDAELARAKTETARFYFERILPRTTQHAAAIRRGSRSLMAMDSALF